MYLGCKKLSKYVGNEELIHCTKAIIWLQYSVLIRSYDNSCILIVINFSPMWMNLVTKSALII
jgi:hypothetical protein